MECCCPRKGKSSFRIARPPIGTRPASAAASVTSFRTLASSPISLSRKTSPLFPLWKSGTPPAPPLALMKCSSLLALIRANSPIAAPANSPAASVNASASPALSPPILPSCSWTSPSAHSIPLRAPSSSANSAPSPAASARPSSSSLTICAKLCSSPRALSCSKSAASLPAPRRRNFFALTTPRSAPSLHLSSCPREPPHEPPNDHLVFLRRSPRRNPRRHPRSPRARPRCHDHCHSHRRPARHVHCATARLAHQRAGRRQRDGAQGGPLHNEHAERDADENGNDHGNEDEREVIEGGAEDFGAVIGEERPSGHLGAHAGAPGDMTRDEVKARTSGWSRRRNSCGVALATMRPAWSRTMREARSRASRKS